MSSDNLLVFEQAIRALETILVDSQLTELKTSGVYVAELSEDNPRSIWRRVARVLSDADDEIGDDLQWFAHLADREGCELAFN